MNKRATRAPQPRQTVPEKRPTPGRERWLKAARQALIEEGTAGVEINKLARRLKTSRSVFYWLFRDRQQLLTELLQDWARTSTGLFEKIVTPPRRSGLEEYRALVDLWVSETIYDPRWDGAVRDWARTSDVVRKAVQKVDKARIWVITQIFQRMGYGGMQARIRARVTYYHQVGYYALGVRESRTKRRDLLPYYERVLTGQCAKE